MKRFGIVGGGFTGTMTAVQLIERSPGPCDIILVNERETLNRGIAYNTYSEKHILNVITGKMSAFPDRPDHFLDWVMQRPYYSGMDRTLIANAFLPRRLYGDYLCEIWAASLEASTSKNIVITVIDSVVDDLEITGNTVTLKLENGLTTEVDHCIIATGNQVPGNQRMEHSDFFSSPNYFQNPWLAESVQNTKEGLPLLIMGNGLTMVDTVIGLIENGFRDEIYSLSPNGFNILPHRHNGLKYSRLTEDLHENMSLHDLVAVVNRHIKTVREFGVSAEPVIDSLRPHTQKIWRSLTDAEKSLFMSRLRHLWGVARHRIPLHTHDRIQQLRIDGRLHIRSGRIIGFREKGDCVLVRFMDKKEQAVNEVAVSRVINCTGPETDLMNLDRHFLKSCLLKGIVHQDKLCLGIRTEVETFRILDRNGKPHANLYTLGSNLKGELWESTAVNELRAQAEKLAGILTAQEKG